jgi:hypothetical protein
MFTDARDVLDQPGPPPELPADPTRSPAASWPPELDGAWVNQVLDEDARLEAAYRVARAARLEPLAKHLGLKPEYVQARDRDRLREDAAVIRLVRWLFAAGRVDGWPKACHRYIARGHFSWVPASILNWYRARAGEYSRSL